MPQGSHPHSAEFSRDLGEQAREGLKAIGTLQTLCDSGFHDPFNHISLEEPDISTFEIPGGYSVVDERGPATVSVTQL